MKSRAALTVAVAILLPAGPAVAQDSCPLLPEFRRASEQCRRDPSPDACAWIAAAEAAATQRPYPEKLLETRLGLSPEVASKLLLLVLLLADHSLDPDCKDFVVSPQMSRLDRDEARRREDMAYWNFVLFFKGPRLAAPLAQLELTLDPSSKNDLRRAAAGFAETLKFLGKEDLPRSLLKGVDRRAEAGGLTLWQGGADDCPPLKEFQPLIAQCRMDRQPDFCGWIEAVQAFGRPGSQPETDLRIRFGLTPRLAAQLLPALATLAVFATEPSCKDDALMQRLPKLIDAKFWDDEEFAATAFVIFFEDPRFNAISDLEDFIPEDRPPLLRAARALAELKQRSGKEDYLDAVLRGSAGLFEATDGILWQGSLDTFTEAEMSELQQALNEFSQGAGEVGRDRLDRLCSSSGPRMALRAGYALSRRGVLEDAERLLRQAQEQLFPSRAEDPEGIYLGALTLWVRIRVLTEMGLPAEAGPLKNLLDSIEDPVAKALIAALAAPDGPFVRDNIKGGLDWGAMVAAEELARSRGTYQELWRAYRTIAPFDTSGSRREVDTGRIGQINRLLAEVKSGNLAGAESLAEKYLELIPRYEGIDVLTRIARDYLLRGGSGDRDALRVARRMVDLVETSLSSFELDETARSFIDGQLHPVFAFAIDIAAGSGEKAAGFELSERSRAFTLRRRLGAARPLASAPLSAGEAALERSIVELERNPQASRERLTALHLEFERLRLDRQFRDRQALNPDQPRESVGAVADLRRALAPGEILLVFHEVLGPPAVLPRRPRYFPNPRDMRLWIWLLPAEGELVQARGALTRLDRERLDCLSQALRWQEAPQEGRGAASSRGVEILAECPGLEPGTDPAQLLYTFLITPIEQLLEKEKRLVVVPHQQLHAVPFAALRNPRTGRRLIEDFEVSVAPSAEVLRQLRQKEIP